MTVRRESFGGQFGRPRISSRVVGTSGASSATDGRGPRVTDLNTITHGDDDLVGRQVTIDRVRLTPAKADGYWLQSETERLYVLPAGNLANLSGKTGQDVRIEVSCCRCRAASAASSIRAARGTTTSTSTRRA